MFYVFKELKWFFKENKFVFFIVILSLLLANIFSVMIPKLVGNGIDMIDRQVLDHRELFALISFMVFISISEYITNYLWGYYLFERQAFLEKTLRGRLFEHFLKMSSPFFEKNTTGDLMAKVTNDINNVGEAISYGTLTFLDSTLYLATIVFVMMYTISWKLTLVTMIPLPLLIYFTKKVGSKIFDRYQHSQNVFGKLNDIVLEDVTATRLIRAYSLEDRKMSFFQKEAQNLCDANVSVAKLNSLFYPGTRLTISICYLISISYGAHLIQEGSLTLGSLISFNVLLNMLVWPMVAIGEFINVIERGNASMNRIEETLSYEPELKDAQHITELKEIETVEFLDYRFSYPSSSSDVLKRISFTLQKGKTLGIVGKTGSGKTTIVRAILSEYPECMEGYRINNLPRSCYAQEFVLSRIGYVPQEHLLFSKSIRENILVGNREASDEEVEEALIISDLKKDIDSFSDGLNTLIGEKGVAISGGQKQRISIARAILRKPEILILDDALSAVDAKTERKIVENIRTYRKDRTNIIISHRMSAVMLSDEIIVLKEGEISERGNHSSLMRQEGWYAEQFNVQNKYDS